MKLLWGGMVFCGLVLAMGCGSRSRLLGPDPSSGGTGALGGGGGGGGVGGIGGVGGSGGAPLGGAGGTSSCGPIDSGAPCTTLSETGCLTAFPRCAPVYDDECCSSCDPGPCADCVSWRFQHCVDRELSDCEPGTIGLCGFTPPWACSGGKADCSSSQCNSMPGCVEALPQDCPEDSICGPECHAVTAGSCGPLCEISGPSQPCPATTTREHASGKLTGYCIPSEVCALGPSDCPAQMPSGTCATPGQICTYGGWCKNTCTCDGGVWSCITPPC